MKVTYQSRLFVFVIGFSLIALSISITYLPLIQNNNEDNQRASGQRSLFQSGEAYLIIEALDDDLLHFETGVGESPSVDTAISTSPMVFRTDYPGASTYQDNGNGVIDTALVRAIVDRVSLCVTIIDKNAPSRQVLTEICPQDLRRSTKSLTFSPEKMQAIYGLGEQFLGPDAWGTLDWTGKIRRSVDEFGNAMIGFSGGATGNAQFPILYALGPEFTNYAVFVDSLYRQSWDFTGAPWKVSMQGEVVRWYVMTGPNLPDLHGDYMELVGKPLVPPLKAFGLWISEYGYDNWEELEGKLASLRENQFPVDGFVLDLQWFGSIETPEGSQMGSLTWDREAFPDPEVKIEQLREEGIGLIPIEESYINKKLEPYASLEERGFLVRGCVDCSPTPLIGWWGIGSMIDWTNPQAGAYWHNNRRQPLVDMGILGHWTDLGEPEMYNRSSYYFGFPEQGLHSQADVHNIYNFRWSESIYQGYQRSMVNPRPWILSRSGTSGVQRFGTAMWSADIGSNWVSLSAHLNAQAHMSLSGMDYFGSDIGGFHRGTIGEDLDELYTQWFAAASFLDVPVRPHTENLCNCKETAPDRVGDPASNLANLRLRYALTPYLYSLAHRAYQDGEPVFPPLFFYYQSDPVARQLGDHKLIGQDLLVVTPSGKGLEAVDVYLPGGNWVNYYTGEQIKNAGGAWQQAVPLFIDGLYRPALYAREGAIIPLLYIDEATLNVEGLRRDGTQHNELTLRIFPGAEGKFILYEDDGKTDAYRLGQVRTTEIFQSFSSAPEDSDIYPQLTVVVSKSAGSYHGAISSRDNILQLVLPSSGSIQPERVTIRLNGALMPPLSSSFEFSSGKIGWFYNGEILQIRSGVMGVEREKVFVFEFK